MKQLTKTIVLTLALSVGLTGCGSTTDDPASAADQENDNASVDMAVNAITKVATKAINANIKDENAHVDIKSNGQEITVSNVDNGEESSFQVGPDMTIPDDFPADVPLPDDLKIFSVMNVDGKIMISGASKQDIKILFDQTDKVLKDFDWKSSFNSKSPEGSMFYYQKGERITGYTIAKVAEKDLKNLPGYVSSVSIVAQK